jgi:hypothetical protein
MADQSASPQPPPTAQPQPLLQQAGQPLIAGNSEFISGFSIAINPQEILIALGRSRGLMVPLPEDPSRAVVQPAAEWFSTLLMSPTMAKLLALALEQALQAYEKQNGKIPMAPSAPAP